MKTERCISTQRGKGSAQVGEDQATATSDLVAWRGREVKSPGLPHLTVGEGKTARPAEGGASHYLGRVYSISNIVSKWLSNGREEGRLDREKQERY